MRKSGIVISLTVILCCAWFLVSTIYCAAATFHIGSTSITNISKGSVFYLPVSIDTDDKPITGADAVITYDPAVLTLVQVEDLHFFPFFMHKESPGSIRLSGVVTDVKNLKKGSEPVAKIQFKAIKSGSTAVHIVCDTSTNDTSKIVYSDLDATNIITCAQITDKTLQISEGSLFSSVTQFLFGWWK